MHSLFQDFNTLLNRIHVEPQQSLKSWSECGIPQQELQIIKSIMALWFCKSEHPAAQLDFSHCGHSPKNQPLHSTSHWTISTVDKCKNWQKGPPSMNSSKS
jgi:hypothetical protein